MRALRVGIGQRRIEARRKGLLLGRAVPGDVPVLIDRRDVDHIHPLLGPLALRVGIGLFLFGGRLGWFADLAERPVADRSSGKILVGPPTGWRFAGTVPQLDFDPVTDFDDPFVICLGEGDGMEMESVFRSGRGV